MVHTSGSAEVLDMQIESNEERERLLREFEGLYDALQDALAQIPPDELDRLRQEVTEEVDEAIRQKVIKGRIEAGWEQG